MVQVYVYSVPESVTYEYWREDGKQWSYVRGRAFPSRTKDKLWGKAEFQLKDNGKEVEFFRDEYFSYGIAIFLYFDELKMKLECQLQEQLSSLLGQDGRTPTWFVIITVDSIGPTQPLLHMEISLDQKTLLQLEKPRI